MLYRHHCFSNLSMGTVLSAFLGTRPFEISWDLHLLTFATTYVAATFLLSPDLDIYHSRPARNWGYFRGIWKPYSSVFGHRKLSHFPILGTSTRLFYLAAIILSLLCFYELVQQLPYESYQSFNFDSFQAFALGKYQVYKTFFFQYENIFYSIFAGAAASDIGHLIIDILGSFFKKFS